MLACGSLGLIGLSRFLQCFISFSNHRLLPCSSVSLLHTVKHCLFIARVLLFIRCFISPIRDAFITIKTITSWLHFTRSFKLAHLLLKTQLHSKKTRQPCQCSVSIRRAHASRFFLLPPSLHSQRLAFIQAYAFTHTRWLKAELPVLFCIVFINENTAKIMCLLCFAKVKPSVFVIISTLQVVLSQKTLTKQQATIVLLLSFAFIPSIFNLIRSGVRTFKK